MDKNEFMKTILSQMYIVKAHMETITYLIEQLEEEKEENICKHPISYRKNLTVMGGKEHWICKLCGYEYLENNNIESNK